MIEKEEQARLVALQICSEYLRASDKFAPMNSPHEGYSVILEEMDELWQEVKDKKSHHEKMRAEALQVGAMALRFILDVCDKDE